MLAPLICALLWAQSKTARPRRGGITATLRTAAGEMDFVGLLLVAASLALILIPLGIVGNDEWEHGSLVRSSYSEVVRS